MFLGHMLPFSLSKSIYVSILLCFLAIVVKAQNKTAADSLLQVLEQGISDREKTDIYNLLAKEYERTDSLQASQYVNKAISLAESVNYPEGLSDAYNRMGRVTGFAGDGNTSKQFHEKALSIAQEASYDEGIANAYKEFGFFYVNRGEYDDGRKYFYKQLEVWKKLGNQKEIALSYGNIGLTHDYAGEFPEAMDFYRKGLDIQKELGDKLGVAKSYNNIGVVYKLQGDTPQALKYYHKTLTIMEKLGEKSFASMVSNNIGTIYFKQGNYHLALEYLYQSMSVAEDLEDLGTIGSTSLNISLIHYAQGDYAKALELLQKSLSISKKMANKRSISECYQGIADIYRAQKNYKKALVFFHKGLTLQQEIGHQYRILSSYNGIANTYIQLKKYDLAIENINKALAISSTMGKNDTKPMLLLTLSNTYYELGDMRSSLTYAKQAMELAKKAEAATIRKEAAELLSIIYEKMGRYKEAYQYHKLFKVMHDSLQNKETVRAVTSKELSFQFEKEKAIEAVAQEKKELLYKQELQQREWVIYGAILGLLALTSIIGLVFRSYRQKKKANHLLSEQNEEIQQQAEEISAQRDQLVESNDLLAEQNEEIQQQAEEISAQRDQLVETNSQVMHAYENIKMLSDIGRQVSTTLSVEAISEAVYENVNELMDATVFALGVYNPATQTMDFTGTMERGKKLDFHSDVTTNNDSLSDYCFNQQTEIFVRDMDKEYREYLSERKVQDGEQMRSIMYMPLSVKGEQKGLITVQSPIPDQYNDNQRNILRNIALYAATAIDNADQHERSEKLLLNILPKTTAKELKTTGKASTKRYEQVSVLFTDFKGFTQISEGMEPEEVVANLDYCFRTFDDIVKKHGLEKIKTIGDAYMCASGIPEPNQDNAQRCVSAALEMRSFMQEWKEEKTRQNEKAWEVRIGIHTGPLVAGVVGKDKFAYDIWGDTVNTASRMESSGEVGKVNISDATYTVLANGNENSYTFSYRGEVEAKGKGKVGMWFVE